MKTTILPHKEIVHKYSYSYYETFDKYVEKYEELPPIFKLEKTRWGDEWNQIKYPTKEPLLDISYREEFPLFYKEAGYYTWICHMQLKDEV